MRKSIVALGCAVALASCENATLPLSPELYSEAPRQALGGPDSISGPPDSIPGGPDSIPVRFIVTLEPKESAEEVAREYGIQPDQVCEMLTCSFVDLSSDTPSL